MMPQAYNGLLQSWPAIIFTFFAGPLSEDYGRKPLIIVGFMGYILLNITFFINSWYMFDLGVRYTPPNTNTVLWEGAREGSKNR